MNITIGALLLTTEKNAPKTSVKFEYYRTENNVVIGGKRDITINGIVAFEDTGSTTGNLVMTQLKNIRDIGKTVKCISVNIPSIYTGQARITNVNIEQGSDPTWVNQGAFSITLEAPLAAIPPNNYRITALDYIKSLSFSEKIELGEDSHGFVYAVNNNLSKAFVKFTCKVSIEVDPICSSANVKTLLENNIKKFLKNGPAHNLLRKYRNWRLYLQDRSYEVSNNTTATLTIDTILLSPSSRNIDAAIDLNFKHSKTYDSGEETKSISGNIKGLANISWSDIIALDSLYNTSKLASAEKALGFIKTSLNNITSWDGIETELIRYNCPPDQRSVPTNVDCLKPSVSSIQKSRTEGSIDFTFDWINSECPKLNKNCAFIEYQVEDQKSAPSIVEHTIPTVEFNANLTGLEFISRFSTPITDGGILVQNLNCLSARRIIFSSTLNLPEDKCPDQNHNIQQHFELDNYRRLYFGSNGLNAADFILIEHTYNISNRSEAIKQTFISKCNNI
jgi:hypothetical protein